MRGGVQAAVRQCHNAHIRIIMVTGDHPATALAVAKEIGLGAGTPKVIIADDLQILLERGELTALHDVDVIARAVPAQKLLLVQTNKSLMKSW